MGMITAFSVDHALWLGVKLIREDGLEIDSRNGPTLELPYTFTTRYRRPWARVIQSPQRKENPFFHLMESLWIISGRNDLEFLVKYLPRMKEFSDDGKTLHGAYGYRLRHGQDQLVEVINRLNLEPTARQVVLQIWDAKRDLNTYSKDTPCNDLIMFRWRPQTGLDMTVCNRSNDMLWGAYGANAVHFSFLHEYVALCTGLHIGSYYQVSQAMHVYTESGVWKRCQDLQLQTYEYPYQPMLLEPARWDHELQIFMEGEWEYAFKEPFFDGLAVPAAMAWEHKSSAALEEIQWPDWKAAMQRYAKRALWTQ